MENTQHQGSEKYHTSVMRDDEVLLFVEAALENAHDAKEATSFRSLLNKAGIRLLGKRYAILKKKP